MMKPYIKDTNYDIILMVGDSYSSTRMDTPLYSRDRSVTEYVQASVAKLYLLFIMFKLISNIY